MNNAHPVRAPSKRPASWTSFLPYAYGLAIVGAGAALAPGFVKGQIEEKVKASVSSRRLVESFAAGGPKLTLDVRNRSPFSFTLNSASLRGEMLGAELASTCGANASLKIEIPKNATKDVDIPLCFGSGSGEAISSMSPDAAPSAVTAAFNVRVMGVAAVKRFSFEVPDDLLREGLRLAQKSRGKAPERRHEPEIRRKNPREQEPDDSDDSLVNALTDFLNAVDAATTPQP